MGLVPRPPTCEKPPPNWSLIRRYSLIVPRFRGPVYGAGENKKLRNSNVPNAADSSVPVIDCIADKGSGCRQGESAIESCACKQQESSNPKLLHAQYNSTADFPGEVREPLKPPSLLCIPANFNTASDLVDLKNHTERSASRARIAVSLIRVPTNFHPLLSDKSSRNVARPIEQLRLLKLSNWTKDVSTPFGGDESQLLTTKYLLSTQPTQRNYKSRNALAEVNFISAHSQNQTIEEKLAPITLLDLRKESSSCRGPPPSIPVYTWMNGPKLIPLETCLSSGWLRKTKENIIGSSSSGIPLLRPQRSMSTDPGNLNAAAGIEQGAQLYPGTKAEYSVSSSTTDTTATAFGSLVFKNHQNATDFGVQVSVISQEKGILATSTQDRGIQFDNILDEDAFIFRNYVIERDGIRQISPGDKDYIPEPLYRQDLLPAVIDGSVVSPMLLNDLLQTDGVDNENQFLSVCSVDLSEWNEMQPKKNSEEIAGSAELSKSVQAHRSYPTNTAQSVKFTRLSECGAQYEPLSDDIFRGEASEPRLANQNRMTDNAAPVTESTREKRSSTSESRPQDEHCADWFAEGSTRVRLDVVKALSELDTRLMTMDRVSNRLEEEHRKNQELLERLIQMNSTRSQLNSPKKVDVITLENLPLNVNESNEENCEPQSLDNPINNEDAQPDYTEQVHHAPRKSRTVFKKRPLVEPMEFSVNRDKQSVSDKPERSRAKSLNQGPTTTTSATENRYAAGRKSTQQAVSNSLTRKRDQARAERRNTLSAKRCEDTVKFVDEVLADCLLTEQSSDLTLLATNKRINPTEKPVIADKLRKSKFIQGRRSATAAKNSPMLKQPTHLRPSVGGAINQPRHSKAKRKATTKGEPIASKSKPNAELLQIFGGVMPEEDEQTTVLSEWSLESEMRRILYGPEVRLNRKSLHSNDQPLLDKDKQDVQTPRSNVEMDQFTDGGAAASSSFIDWEEVDEIVRDA